MTHLFYSSFFSKVFFFFSMRTFFLKDKPFPHQLLRKSNPRHDCATSLTRRHNKTLHGICRHLYNRASVITPNRCLVQSKRLFILEYNERICEAILKHSQISENHTLLKMTSMRNIDSAADETDTNRNYFCANNKAVWQNRAFVIGHLW